MNNCSCPNKLLIMFLQICDGQAFSAKIHAKHKCLVKHFTITESRKSLLLPNRSYTLLFSFVANFFCQANKKSFRSPDVA
jgi:hypothetical protein